MAGFQPLYFSDQKQSAGITTRLEYHALMADGYHIVNTAWRSSTKDVLGNQIALADVAGWADILPEATITNIKAPIVCLFQNAACQQY